MARAKSAPTTRPGADADVADGADFEVRPPPAGASPLTPEGAPGGAATLERPRRRLSRTAPRVAVVAFDEARAGNLLGPRGDVLRDIEATYDVTVDARSAPGEATIVARTPEACEAARAHVDDLVGDVNVGDALVGTVVEVREYGAVLRVLRSRDGLLHMTELKGSPENPEKIAVGEVLDVFVVGVDPILGHVKLSRHPKRPPTERAVRRA